MSGSLAYRNDVATDLVFRSFRVEYAAGGAPRITEYRLRYEAFVEEHNWQPADHCRDRLERDEFDAFSCSAVVTDAATGEAAACQRLILPEELPYGRLTNAERHYRPLPSEPEPAIDFTSLPRSSWAEVSRLTIAPRYRSGSAGASHHAMVAVTYASLALAVALHRTVLFSVSDPRMARLTRRMGFEMHQVGQLVDFHGTRGVFRINAAEVMTSVRADWREAVNHLIDQARLGVLMRDSRTSSHAA